MAIDAIADKDGWLVIEDLHLASSHLLENLRGKLIRVGNTGGKIYILDVKCKINTSVFIIVLLY